MSLRDLMPWRPRNRSLPGALLNHPFRSLYQELDRWLDAFARDMDFDLLGAEHGTLAPTIDIAEADKAFEIKEAALIWVKMAWQRESVIRW